VQQIAKDCCVKCNGNIQGNHWVLRGYSIVKDPIKYSRAIIRVKSLKCSDVSRTSSVLVIETSEHFSDLARLIAQEYFIEFSRRENIKAYITVKDH
jgi:hypothetical protein